MISDQIPVTTGTPTEILRFHASEILNVAIKATAALRIGTASVTATKGFELTAGGAIAYNRIDFPTPNGDYEVILYAATAANTTIDIAGFFER